MRITLQPQASHGPAVGISCVSGRLNGSNCHIWSYHGDRQACLSAQRHDEQNAISVHVNGCALYSDINIEIIFGNVPTFLIISSACSCHSLYATPFEQTVVYYNRAGYRNIRLERKRLYHRFLFRNTLFRFIEMR